MTKPERPCEPKLPEEGELTEANLDEVAGGVDWTRLQIPYQRVVAQQGRVQLDADWNEEN